MSERERQMKQWLRERNIYFGKKTKVEQLEDFFQRVQPITTNRELVRIGENSDGGYLLPSDFEGILACFSPGVSEEIHFELALAEKGIKSFMADYSVDELPVPHPMFDFEKKYLGMDDGPVFMSLENWVSSKVGDGAGDLILQMDIEGSEYEVIFDASYELLRRFRIIVMEFHRLDSLLDKYGYQIINTAFRKLLKIFDIVHIHPNNQTTVARYKEYELPAEMEFTFLRKDRISNRISTTQFPHKLDIKNMHHLEDLILPECWHA